MSAVENVVQPSNSDPRHSDLAQPDPSSLAEASSKNSARLGIFNGPLELDRVSIASPTRSETKLNEMYFVVEKITSIKSFFLQKIDDWSDGLPAPQALEVGPQLADIHVLLEDIKDVGVAFHINHDQTEWSRLLQSVYLLSHAIGAYLEFVQAHINFLSSKGEVITASLETYLENRKIEVSYVDSATKELIEGTATEILTRRYSEVIAAATILQKQFGKFTEALESFDLKGVTACALKKIEIVEIKKKAEEDTSAEPIAVSSFFNPVMPAFIRDASIAASSGFFYQLHSKAVVDLEDSLELLENLVENLELVNDYDPLELFDSVTTGVDVLLEYENIAKNNRIISPLLPAQITLLGQTFGRIVAIETELNIADNAFYSMNPENAGENFRECYLDRPSDLKTFDRLLGIFRNYFPPEIINAQGFDWESTSRHVSQMRIFQRTDELVSILTKIYQALAGDVLLEDGASEDLPLRFDISQVEFSTLMGTSKVPTPKSSPLLSEPAESYLDYRDNKLEKKFFNYATMPTSKFFEVCKDQAQKRLLLSTLKELSLSVPSFEIFEIQHELNVPEDEFKLSNAATAHFFIQNWIARMSFEEEEDVDSEKDYSIMLRTRPLLVQ